MNAVGQKRRIAALLGIAAVAAVIAVLAVSARGYEVVERRSHVTAVRLDILGWFGVELSPEVKPTLDILVAITLFILSGMALLGYLLVRRTYSSSNRMRSFYALLSAGTCFLAIDELFGVHEMLGYNLRSLLEHVGTHEPDDVIFIAYALPVLAFLVVYRDIVLFSKRARVFFFVAAALFAFAAAFDALNLSTPAEDAIEALSAAVLLAGTGTLIVGHILWVLEVPRRASPAVDDSSTEGMPGRTTGSR